MPHLGIIRVLTTKNPEILHSHGRLIKQVFPDWKVTSFCIPDQPLGVYNAETDALATGKVVQLADKMESMGVDCVLVSCMAEPGVEVGRKHLRVPIIGAGSAGAAVAGSLGAKVGVLSITDDPPPVIRRILGKKLLANVRPEGIQTTRDLETPAGIDSVVRSARALVKKGADTILLGCTGMSTARLAPKLQPQLGIPVIDPIIASGMVAACILSGNSIVSDPGGAERTVDFNSTASEQSEVSG